VLIVAYECPSFRTTARAILGSLKAVSTSTSDEENPFYKNTVAFRGATMSRPPHGDVLQIPTPPLQRTALIIIFIFPAFSILFYSLRCYGRVSTRQFGLG
jgi:hypothetical protein